MGQRWAGQQVAEGIGGSHFQNLRFKKTGSDILRAIDGKVELLNVSIDASTARISEICKRREVDPSEVLGADSNETDVKVATYSAAMGERLQAKSALDKLNADMQQLRNEAWGIEGARGEINTIIKVKENIEAERVFDLEFRELSALGF